MGYLLVMPKSCRKLEIILEYGIAAGETPNAKVNRRRFIYVFFSCHGQRTEFMRHPVFSRCMI
jgi:hypothetical protein